MKRYYEVVSEGENIKLGALGLHEKTILDEPMFSEFDSKGGTSVECQFSNGGVCESDYIVERFLLKTPDNSKIEKGSLDLVVGSQWYGPWDFRLFYHARQGQTLWTCYDLSMPILISRLWRYRVRIYEIDKAIVVLKGKRLRPRN